MKWPVQYYIWNRVGGNIGSVFLFYFNFGFVILGGTENIFGLDGEVCLNSSNSIVGKLGMVNWESQDNVTTTYHSILFACTVNVLLLFCYGKHQLESNSNILINDTIYNQNRVYLMMWIILTSNILKITSKLPSYLLISCQLLDLKK